jgi:Glycerophosphoryl diester phosphodiesterase family
MDESENATGDGRAAPPAAGGAPRARADGASSGAETPSSRRISRRTVIGGSIAVVALAVGIPTTVALLNPPSGKLVTPLLASHPFYIAHRGGSDDWPEMSMFAYRNAVANHANALEVSLSRTSDGVWFGLHDGTLDRTSGTHDFVASEHTWAEVNRYRITAAGTDNRHQPSQPYMKFDELIGAYASSHTIFVDPKSASPSYYAELLNIMKRSVRNPRQSFIAKGYCGETVWAQAARADGYKTWGFYYSNEIESGKTPLQDTQQAWDLLGLNYLGSDATWKQVLAIGKPVIAHVIPSRAGASEALAKGAAGLMVSGITQVLG